MPQSPYFGPWEVPSAFHFGGGAFVKIFGFAPNTKGLLKITPNKNAKVLFLFNKQLPGPVPKTPVSGSGGNEWIFGAVLDITGFAGASAPTFSVSVDNTPDPRLWAQPIASFNATSVLGDPSAVVFFDTLGNEAGAMFADVVSSGPTDITISNCGLLLGENRPGQGGIVPPSGSQGGIWFSAGVDGTYTDAGVGGNPFGGVRNEPCSITQFLKDAGMDFAFDITVWEKKPSVKGKSDIVGHEFNRTDADSKTKLSGITKEDAILCGVADATGESIHGTPDEVTTTIVAQNRIRNLGNGVSQTSGKVDVFIAANSAKECWLGGNAIDKYRMVRRDPRTTVQLSDDTLAFGAAPPKYPPIIQNP